MSLKFEIKEATTEEDFISCWPVIAEHHPQLKSLENMLHRLNIQRSEGYRIFYCIEKSLASTPTSSKAMATTISKGLAPNCATATTPEGHKAISYIGFKITHVFFTGKTLHIADLSTLSSARGRGAAGALVDFIVEYAMKSECDHVCLDSTYARTTAHRLYLNKGFVLNAHHFVMQF